MKKQKTKRSFCYIVKVTETRYKKSGRITIIIRNLKVHFLSPVYEVEISYDTGNKSVFVLVPICLIGICESYSIDDLTFF